MKTFEYHQTQNIFEDNFMMINLKDMKTKSKFTDY